MGETEGKRTMNLYSKPLGTFEEEFAALSDLAETITDPDQLRDLLRSLEIGDRLIGLQKEPHAHRELIRGLQARTAKRIEALEEK